MIDRLDHSPKKSRMLRDPLPWGKGRNLAHYESVVFSAIIFTLAFGQRSSSIANAPAACFSTPTALRDAQHDERGLFGFNDGR